MSDFTYEYENRKTPLETYEWDNVWWEHTENKEADRIFYIGDSISCGTRKAVNQKGEGKVLCNGFGTSKAVDNPYFADSLRIFLRQQGKRGVILFNNGLHGFHLSPEQYAEGYERMVTLIRKEFADMPLVLLLSTHVANSERDAEVCRRNEAVQAIAKRHGLGVIDLYAISLAHADLLSPDGVHFIPEGYALFADAILNFVKKEVLK